MNQLHLFSRALTSALPEVRDSAPFWAPESAAGNAAELERLAARRGSPPTEVDCPWCGAVVAVVPDLGVSAGGGAWTRYAGLDDHQRPDGQRCYGTFQALADLRERA